ncbi:hypothetical protein FB566_3276 [Stackebrandtia endophytica]|uniref:Uncharacterized protein n=1 Tax=Stackebrandtia endophytica TaxID=1496996 RepID=A0A543AYR8_9ACTN|nr:hypothetical protein [Stackebrandtia endophytica]TQL77713.1 hypothetical protein FB566_3276 [Stackebrandtia endophytica]
MTDKQLVVTLEDLWKAGAVQLPNMAVLYSQASRDAHNSSWREKGGFTRPERVRHELLPFGKVWRDGPSPMMEPFIQLRDLLQKAIATTADQLAAAGEALVAIGEAYTDQDAANELEIRRAGREEYGLDMPPESIPQPRMPDDPYEVQVIEVPGGEVEVPVR